jgi:hypothetical protein
MKFRWINFLIAAAIVSAACFFLVPVQAANTNTPLSISISPLTFNLSANPGDTLSNEFLVRNDGKQATDVTIQSEDFVAVGEEGQVALTTKASTFSLSSWIDTGGNTPYTIQPGQQITVKFLIRVPFNAEPGGHYASVYAQISPTINNAQTGSYVGQKIGALILLRVAGPVTEKASIKTFNTTKSIYTKGPVTFNTRIGNSGTVHISPVGLITVTDMFGKKSGNISIPQRDILPGAIRHTQTTWKNTPKFGKFTATLLAYYGDNNTEMVASTTFWIIPWMTILFWTVIIVIIIVLIWLLRDRIKSAGRAFLKQQK